MVRISSPISVPEDANSDLVVVGAFSSCHQRGSGDAERDAHDSGLEDALRALQRDSVVLKKETRSQRPRREDLTVKVHQILEERKRSESDESISVVPSHDQILHRGSAACHAHTYDRGPSRESPLR